MPEEGINGKSEEPIRRALKKLPQVKAAPDFEARLQRRLNEPERHEGGRTRFGFIPFRVPALGYSLVALVLVGVVSYYMFWRTGVVPVSTQEMVAPPPAASSEGKTESAPLPAIGNVEAEKPAATPTASGRRKAAEPLTENKKSPAEKREASKDDRLSKQAPTNAEEGVRSLVAPQSSLKAGEPLRDEQKAAAQKLQVQQGIQQNIQIEEPKKQNDVERLKSEESAPSAARKIFDGKALTRSAAAYSAIAVPDSARIRDSLLLDSLKRALLRLDSLQGKPRIKKPGE